MSQTKKIDGKVFTKDFTYSKKILADESAKILSEEMSLRKSPFRFIPKGAKLNSITLMYGG